MAHYNTILHSLSRFLPRHVFDTLEQQIDQSDRRRKSSRYEQFIALLTVQILGLDSLREIEAEGGKIFCVNSQTRIQVWYKGTELE